METAEIIQLNTEPGFPEFWALTHPYRKRDKITAHKKWTEITSPAGLDTTMKDNTTGERFNVHWQATAEDLILAHKAHRMQLLDNPPEQECYIPMVSTWLNRGTWQDLDLAEIQELADRWDALQSDAVRHDAERTEADTIETFIMKQRRQDRGEMKRNLGMVKAWYDSPEPRVTWDEWYESNE